MNDSLYQSSLVNTMDNDNRLHQIAVIRLPSDNLIAYFNALSTDLLILSCNSLDSDVRISIFKDIVKISLEYGDDVDNGVDLILEGLTEIYSNHFSEIIHPTERFILALDQLIVGIHKIVYEIYDQFIDRTYVPLITDVGFITPQNLTVFSHTIFYSNSVSHSMECVLKMYTKKHEN